MDEVLLLFMDLELKHMLTFSPVYIFFRGISGLKWKALQSAYAKPR